MSAFSGKTKTTPLLKPCVRILQVNVGDRCNQSCAHCHVAAGPTGARVVSRSVLEDIIEVLARDAAIGTVDITGGAPELVPDMPWFVASLRPLGRRVLFRTNLTALRPGELFEALRDARAEIVASMPCYTRENVDAQRGPGVFDRCIESLRWLNAMGFGSNGLDLSLMYNPGGPFLPGDQAALEEDYRRELGTRHGVVFTRLYTLANAPIGRFREALVAAGELDAYDALLREAFNPATLDHVMCRDTLSVGFDGRLYDCDFNQALGLEVAGPVRRISDLKTGPWESTRVVVGDHCFVCTAGAGCSCQGALDS